MTENRENHHRDRLPYWDWANVLSLDSVLVGLVWLFVFTQQFCRRDPSPYELTIIGLSIWLVYTADRLFDSFRLDLSQSHSKRHRFHFQYRTRLCVGWFVILALDTAVVVSCATDAQLRWGCAAIAIVVAYVAGVQFSSSPRTWLPKELQAGMIFAFGVSLTAWAESVEGGISSLLVSTVMAGLLFTANCVTIAALESELDALQKFDSLVLRMPFVATVLPRVLALHATVSFALVVTQTVPSNVGGCLIASDIALCTLIIASKTRIASVLQIADGRAWPAIFVTLADVALVVPPVAWLVAGTIV